MPTILSGPKKAPRSGGTRGAGRGARVGSEHVGDGGALFGELGVGRGDLGLGEVVHRMALDDLVSAGGGRLHGHSGPDVGVEAVAALALDGDAVDLAGGHEVADVIDEGVGGGGGRGEAAGGDDGG